MEALSRGAASVEFVERAPAALAVLRANLAKLGVTEGFRVNACGVGAWLRRRARDAGSGRGPGAEPPFNLVFLDPPYDAAEEYGSTLRLLGSAGGGLLAPDARVIAEHLRKERLGERYGSLLRVRLLEQGDAALSFFAPGPIGSGE